VQQAGGRNSGLLENSQSAAALLPVLGLRTKVQAIIRPEVDNKRSGAQVGIVRSVPVQRALATFASANFCTALGANAAIKKPKVIVIASAPPPLLPSSRSRRAS
jgi:hypothetical protein